MSDRDRDEAPLEVAILYVFLSGDRVEKKMIERVDLHHALSVGAKAGVTDLDIRLDQTSDWDCVQPLADHMQKHDWQVLNYGREEIDKLLERWGTDDPDLEADLCFELAEGIIQWSKNVRCIRNPVKRNVSMVGWYFIHDFEQP